MSFISPRGEASTLSEIEALTALNNLAASATQVIRKLGVAQFENVTVITGTVASHIQVDVFTTTAGQQTFTASKNPVESTILLIINGQPLMPTTDWTFISPNQMQTVSDVFLVGLPVLWIYIN